MGLQILFYCISPLDYIIGIPILSFFPFVFSFLIILALGFSKSTYFLIFSVILIILGITISGDNSLYIYKSAISISAFISLIYARVAFEGEILQKYLALFCYIAFAFMTVSFVNDFGSYVNYFLQLRPSTFVFKDIDAYELIASIKFSWIFGQNAHEVFSGINLFLPFFLFTILSLHNKKNTKASLSISAIPILVMFSRSSLIFIVLNRLTNIGKKSFYVFILYITFAVVFYVYSFNYSPEILRGRDLIINEVISSNSTLFFGAGPGMFITVLEESVGHGSIHNIFFEIFVSYGLFGALLFFLLFAVAFFHGNVTSPHIGFALFFSVAMFSFNIADIGFFVTCAGLAKLITFEDLKESSNHLTQR